MKYCSRELNIVKRHERGYSVYIGESHLVGRVSIINGDAFGNPAVVSLASDGRGESLEVPEGEDPNTLAYNLAMKIAEDRRKKNSNLVIKK